MPTTSTTLEWRLSGGASNTNAGSALGGAMSSVAVGSTLFDAVNAAESTSGSTEYRCVYLRNSGSVPASNVKVFISFNTASPSTEIWIAKGNAAVNGTEGTVGAQTTAPSPSLTWSLAVDATSGLSLPNIPANGFIAIWFRRIVSGGALESTDNWTWNVNWSSGVATPAEIHLLDEFATAGMLDDRVPDTNTAVLISSWPTTTTPAEELGRAAWTGGLYPHLARVSNGALQGDPLPDNFGDNLGLLGSLSLGVGGSVIGAVLNSSGKNGATTNGYPAGLIAPEGFLAQFSWTPGVSSSQETFLAGRNILELVFGNYVHSNGTELVRMRVQAYDTNLSLGLNSVTAGPVISYTANVTYVGTLTATDTGVTLSFLGQTMTWAYSASGHTGITGLYRAPAQITLLSGGKLERISLSTIPVGEPEDFTRLISTVYDVAGMPGSDVTPPRRTFTLAKYRRGRK